MASGGPTFGDAVGCGSGPGCHSSGVVSAGIQCADCDLNAAGRGRLARRAVAWTMGGYVVALDVGAVVPRVGE